MALTHFLTFASEAELLTLVGAGFWLVALVALFADRRRTRREPITRLNKVGWMPWTAIFMACMIIGGGLLALALPRALFGGD